MNLSGPTVYGDTCNGARGSGRILNGVDVFGVRIGSTNHDGSVIVSSDLVHALVVVGAASIGQVGQ